MKVQSESEKNPLCSVIADMNQAKQLLLLAQNLREGVRDKRLMWERCTAMTLRRRDRTRLKLVWGL